jgi:ketosteroid isomerase-like protein
MSRWKCLLLCLLAVVLCQGVGAEEENHEDHEALRALLLGATTTVNEQKFENLSNYFHPNLLVTTVNQETIIKPEKLEPYFRSWVGPEQYVLKMNMTMEADELTAFYGEGASRFGVVSGKGVEDYELADGRRLKLDTRWTATVVKDDQGAWKIIALHLGTNFYNNPIVEQFQAATKTYAIGGAVGGLLLGILLTFLMMRRKGA